MPRMQRKLSRLLTGAAAVVLASLLMAACGGSSKGSSATQTTASAVTAASATTSTSTTQASTARFAKLRACMQKQGITLPQTRQSVPRTSGALGVEGGPQLPKGVSRTRFDAALKKCGARSFGGSGLAGGRLNNPEFRAALARFAECLRAGGLNVPAPKVSGTGPVFTTKGLHTGSPQFLKVERKCSPMLAQAFRRAQGANPPGTNPGAPGPLGAVPTPKQ